MKTRVLLLILSVCMFLQTKTSLAQDSARGIYLNATDFISGKISYAPLKGKKYKWKLHENFNRNIIEIGIGDSTYHFFKDSIYGFRDERGDVYRIYRKENYRVLNPTENIIIYSQKITEGNKSSHEYIQYYFSANPTTEIHLLNKMNLKTAFADNNTFHELLDMYFKDDVGLTGYDQFYKMYKINRVLIFSNQIMIKK